MSLQDWPRENYECISTYYKIFSWGEDVVVVKKKNSYGESSYEFLKNETINELVKSKRKIPHS